MVLDGLRVRICIVRYFIKECSITGEPCSVMKHNLPGWQTVGKWILIIQREIDQVKGAGLQHLPCELLSDGEENKIARFCEKCVLACKGTGESSCFHDHQGILRLMTGLNLKFFPVKQAVGLIL